MKNLSIENITKACRGTFHGDKSILSQEVSGVVIDSRKVQPGYLFVAIDGERVNAHKFIPDTVSWRRKRGQGAMPLAGLRGGAPYGAWGNAPTVAPLNLLKEEKQVRQLRRRQRSVPAHKLKNFQ